MLKGRFERLLLKWVSWGALGVLALLVLFLSLTVWDVRGKQRLAYQERENARIALVDITERHETLSANVKNFESERGLEEEFRKRFPVAKEGEEVIVLVDAPVSDEVPPSAPSGLWGTIRSWFGL